MGFLDHSTNNIIVDAVLTDEGRKRLASNNGSFSIDMFAFGDDEVDYGLIKKYGKAVGKEKIEKNTPIFEGLTLGNLEQKYKLIGISNPFLTKLPRLTLTTDVNQLVFTPKISIVKFNIKQTITNDSEIDKELTDKSYTIMLNDMFLSIDNVPSEVSYNKVATYYNVTDNVITNSDNSGTNMTIVLTKKNISDSLFSIYKDPGNSDRISTVVRVTGDNTGATLLIPVSIER